MKRIFRDAAKDAAFAEQGYVIVPLLSPEEATEYLARGKQLVPEAPAVNDPQGAMYSSLYDGDQAQPGALLAHQAKAARCEALLADFRFLGGTIMAKVAGSGPLALHQHPPSTPDIHETVLQCWLTLEDVGPDNGALRVVPRSHRIVRHIQSYRSKPYFIDFAQALEERYAVTIPMRAGEAILFERTLLHGSCPNRSDAPAFRLLSTLIPRESRPCLLSELDGEIFEAFEPGDGPVDRRLYGGTRGDVTGLRKVGRVANRNMRLTEPEFAELLRRGRKIRPGYDPIDEVRARLRPGPVYSALRRVTKAVLKRTRQ